ncbi:MAG: hypothetical protein IK128_03885 [Clostridiales bacterium]|nr:hypothetical protein [Clostridiales bacterium]
MTRREFYKSDEMAQVRKNIRVCAISAYVIAALSLLVNLLLLDNPTGILDSITMVVLGLLIQLLQSRVAAILLAIYGVVNMIAVTIMTGKFGGWWIMVVAIWAVVYTFKFHKAWKEEKELQKFRDGTYRVDPDSFNE